MTSVLSRVFSVFFATLLLGGCALIPAPHAYSPLPTATTDTRFILMPGDELEIKYPGRTDLNELVRVRPDGRIALPYIGPLMAATRTPEELAEAIEVAFMQQGSGDAPSARARYLLDVRDELEIRFPFHGDMNQVVRVRPDGKISLPLVGTLPAEGISPEALEARLNIDYAKHLRKPNVSVSVRQFSSSRISVDGRAAYGGLRDLRPAVLVRGLAPRQIYVAGEVERSGVLLHRPNLSLLQALAEAGGLKAGAYPANAVIIRRGSDGNATLVRVDTRILVDYNIENLPLDPILQPSDLIIIPKTPIASLGDAVDQALRIVPPLRNSSFGFVYQMNNRSDKQ